jgi:hypothetical protein
MPDQTVDAGVLPKPAADPGSARAAPETIQLGSSIIFTDVRPPASCRGRLPTPPAVAAVLEEHSERLEAMAPRTRQRFVDDLNLSYFFGGRQVAFRQTDQGIEVLAVGPREIKDLQERLSPLERLGVVEEEVRPW